MTRDISNVWKIVVKARIEYVECLDNCPGNENHRKIEEEAKNNEPQEERSYKKK